MRDLSIVTDTLRDILTDAVNTSPVFGGSPPPFSVTVSGQHPQTPGLSDCELNVYLFHVAPNKHLANSFWSQGAQHGTTPAVASEPLGLDLWYMVSAQSKTSYVHEQQILGIAMQSLHDNAILRLNTPTPLPGAITPSQATIVLEAPNFDELSRLWQAFGLPLRTTAEYRVSVAFLTPDTVPADMPQVEVVNLVATPDIAKGVVPAQLFSTRRTLVYTAPGPIEESVQLSPATTAPAPGPAADAQEVVLDGAGVQTGDHVVLVSYPAGVRTESDVTATWVAPGDPPFRLTPPTGVGAPEPGRHEVVVTRPAEPGWQSNPVPLDVAAWIDPAGGPLVTQAPPGRYTITVGNVPAAGVVVRLGTTALTRITAGTPLPGQWRLTGTTLTFAAPTGTTSGTYLVGLRANDVEADPVKWAVVP